MMLTNCDPMTKCFYAREFPQVMAILASSEPDIEFICEICGDELDEYGKCYTCSGVYNG